MEVGVALLLLFVASRLLEVIPIAHILLQSLAHPYFLGLTICMIILARIERDVLRFRTFMCGLLLCLFLFALCVFLVKIPHFCADIFCLGAVLNYLAILANKGQMPVVDGLHVNLSFIHKPVDADTKLLLLCDYIVINNKTKFTASIGDILIWLSCFISLAHIFSKYF